MIEFTEAPPPPRPPAPTDADRRAELNARQVHINTLDPGPYRDALQRSLDQSRFGASSLHAVDPRHIACPVPKTHAWPPTEAHTDEQWTTAVAEQEQALPWKLNALQGQADRGELTQHAAAHAAKLLRDELVEVKTKHAARLAARA